MTGSCGTIYHSANFASLVEPTEVLKDSYKRLFVYGFGLPHKVPKIRFTHQVNVSGFVTSHGRIIGGQKFVAIRAGDAAVADGASTAARR